MRRFRALPTNQLEPGRNVVIRMPDVPAQQESSDAGGGAVPVNGILYQRFLAAGFCWKTFYFAGVESGAVTWTYLGTDYNIDIFPLSAVIGSLTVITLDATVYGQTYTISTRVCDA